MASLKPILKNDFVKSDGKANIKIRISHRGKVRYIATPWDIEAKHMGADGRIKSNYPGQARLNGALLALMKQYNDIIADIGPDIMFMDVNSIVDKLKGQVKYGSSFTQYMNNRINELVRQKRFSYAESYQVTLNHLKDFAGSNIEFKDINTAFLRNFEEHLKLTRNAKVNTVRIYLNNIKAVFYHAIDAEIIKANLFPFRKYRIQQETSRKRSLDTEDLKNLLVLRDSLTGKQKIALDIFFLVFYLIGINLKDLIYLKPENIYKGRLFYKRFKTGREYSIKIFPQAKEIINRYKGEKYLLYFMETKKKNIAGTREGYEHKDFLQNINARLEIVGKKAGLPVKLTTYYARHSWSSIAANLDIPSDIISHALGHSMGNPTTAIYIDYNLQKVDQANEKVISSVFQGA